MNLAFQLVLDPQIIGIQETDVLPAGLLDPQVTGFGNAGILSHAKIPYAVPGLDQSPGIVGGTVIDNDKLVVFERLGHNRIDSVAQTETPVISGDNDGNRRMAIIHPETRKNEDSCNGANSAAQEDNYLDISLTASNFRPLENL